MTTGYPRLVEGIAPIPVDDGYVLDGGPRREHFTGRTASTVFPRLVPMLDGTRQTSQLADALDLPTDGVRRIVDLLRERGIVEVNEGPLAAVPGSPPMRVFLRRTLSPGRGDVADARLRAAHVHVAGSGSLADLVADLLDRSGVGEVRRGEVRRGEARRGEVGRGAVGRGAVDAAPDLVIPADQPVGPDNPVPALPVHRLLDRIVVGPLVHAPGGGCSRCVAAELDRYAAVPDPAASEASIGVVAGLVAGHAVRYLAGEAGAETTDRVVEVLLSTGEVRTRPVTRRPDCPGCGQAGLNLTGDALAEYTYEHAVSTPFAGWRTDDLDLEAWQAPPRAYLTQRRISAPRHRAAGTGTDRLAADLRWMFTGGRWGSRRPGAPVRQPCDTATAGCPGSTRAYLLGDVSGTGHGSYHVDGASGEFVVLPGSPDAAVRDPGRLVVALTADLPVLEPVLADASRRVAYQDAGLVLARMDVLARATGRRAYAGPDTDGVSELLDLSPGREIVTLVADLEPVPAPEPRATASQPRATAAEPRAAVPALPRWPTLAYRFADRPVEADPVLRAAAEGRARAEEVWSRVPRAGSPLGCILYARNVVDLPWGLYALDTGAAAGRLADMNLAPLESALAARHVDAPALLLFTGNLGRALADHGAAGYRLLLGKAASAAGFVRHAAAGNRLTVGLFARLPGWLVAAGTHTLHADRVLYGCAIGHPPERSEQPEREHVRW